MLQVTIYNIDQSFHGVFEHAPLSQLPPPGEKLAKRAAVDSALKDLIKNHGFFAENRVAYFSDYPDFPTWMIDNPEVIGMLVISGQHPQEMIGDENTYFVKVKPLALGVMSQ